MMTDMPEIMNSNCEIMARKFKGGICCGSHLAAMYGAEYLCIRSYLSPQASASFLSGMGLIMHDYWSLRDESHSNNCAGISLRMIAPKLKVQ